MSSPSNIYDDFNSWDNNAPNLGEGNADGNQEESVRTPGPVPPLPSNLGEENQYESFRTPGPVPPLPSNLGEENADVNQDESLRTPGPVPPVSTNQELGNNANQNEGLEFDATILQAQQDLLDHDNKVCNSPPHTHIVNIIYCI